jgi:hypothetical protein
MALAVTSVVGRGLAVTQSAMGMPVTAVASGGLAVTPVAAGGLPVFDTAGTLFGPAVIPANTVLPVITGTPAVGTTLLTSSGTWSGTTASYTYQWKRGGVNIAGATTSSYLLVTADLGANITVTVTATNTAGSANATSAAVGPVTVAAPTNSAIPVISGSTVQGGVLTTTDGTWMGSPTFAYQWKRGGTNVGTNTNTYTSVVGDVGSTITVTVTATNAGGNANATSTAVGPITAFSLPAPVLAWTSGPTGFDPIFTATFVAAVADILTLEIDDNSDFSSLFDSDVNTLDSAEVAAGTITYSGITTLFAGVTYYARLKLQRGAASVYSNTVNQTMAGFTSRTYVAEGDSISAVGAGGWNNLANAAAVPAIDTYAAAAIGGSALGSPGDAPNPASLSLYARAPSLDARLIPGGTNILSVLIGANGMGPSFLVDFAAYLNARRAAGWYVILCTILPNVSINSATPSRNTVNTELRLWAVNGSAVPGKHADRICDFAAEPSMGDDADYSDTTYYLDGLHPTTLGHEIMRRVFQPVLDASQRVDTTAPTITSANTAHVAPSVPLAFTLTASESCTWSVSGAGFSIATVNSLVHAGTTTGTYTCTVTATDGSGNASAPQSFSMVVDTVASSVVATYRSGPPAQSANTVFTFASQPIGTASSDRIVVVVCEGNRTTSGGTLTMTIGGVAATSVSPQGDTADYINIFYLNVPTGTTADVVVTITVFTAQMQIAVYTVTGSSAPPASGVTAWGVVNPGPMVVTATVPTGGIGIAGFATDRDVLPTTWSGNATVDLARAGPGTQDIFALSTVTEGVVTITSGNEATFYGAVMTTWGPSGPDVTAPTIVSYSPLDNATGVLTSIELVVTFNETVTLGTSGTISLKKTSDNSTIDSWNVATAGGSTAGKVEIIGGTALHIHLTANLANSTEYYVVWPAGVVKDTAGNGVAAQSSTTAWSFTTASAGAGFGWNTADKAPGTTLANSDRDLTGTTAGTYSSVRAVTGKTTGRWYCEVTLPTIGTSATQGGVGLGIANATFALTSGAFLGSGEKSAMFFWANQATYNLTAGDTLQIAFDLTAGAGKVWLGKNNTWMVGSPSAGTAPWLTFTPGSDTWFIGGMENVLAGSNTSVVARLAATGVYTPPTGFTLINS